MSFASDITDKKKLPPACSCSALASPNTYDQRLRIQRACIATSVAGSYTLTGIAITDGGLGYAVGDYVTIAYGSPSLIAFVSAVDASGAVTSATVINVPVFTGAPVNPVASTVFGSSVGVGATFTLTVQNNTAICCSCS
jgi:hypothetical protein